MSKESMKITSTSKKIYSLTKTLGLGLLIFFSFKASATPEGAIENLMKLFGSSSKSTTANSFSVEKCKISQKQLMELALLRQPVKTSFKFMKGCDVEGEVELHVDKPFPVSLKVRNLDKYSTVKFISTLTVGSVDEGIGYKVELNDGNLSGKKSSVLFQGVYNYILSLGDSKNPKAQEGGEINIHSIDGEKVSFKKLLGKGSGD